MYLVQIAAGNDPPVTVFSPPVLESDTGNPAEFSLAISTAVDSCGVYPTNQALLLPSVVPVLALAGRFRSRT